MNLEKRHILITGSACRLGRALSEYLAARGAHLALHYNTSADAVNELFAHLGGEAAGHHIFHADLTLPDAAENLFKNVRNVAPLDAIINNASIYTRTDAEETPEITAKLFALHVAAPETLTRLLADEKQCGIILNIGDAFFNPSGTIYAQTKRALIQNTCTNARKFTPRLRVNAICPGPFLPPSTLPESKMQKSIARLPLHRAVDTQDLCHAAELLLTNDSMTGVILPVDCGASLL